ncbi:MAG: manganese efflux pump MntP family protein [Candidatus Bathyarchaeota archaeon]|jgi:putative Mn2+ efflux pump MntP|nr:manganese efflux pump MntP family protein [Candidatus Bathyarchaeota archaeon]
MDPIIIFIAVGLAMDSFSVAIASNLTQPTFHLHSALKIAFFFGFFQGIMPVIGWLVGTSILGIISQYDHWVAFGLLLVIGSRMIYEAVQTDVTTILSIHKLSMLVMLSLATSIDALAVGLSLSILDIPIVIPGLVIGIITWILSFLGVYLGHIVGAKVSSKVSILGGLLLIGIGAKILLDHLLAS